MVHCREVMLRVETFTGVRRELVMFDLEAWSCSGLAAGATKVARADSEALTRITVQRFRRKMCDNWQHNIQSSIVNVFLLSKLRELGPCGLASLGWAYR